MRWLVACAVIAGLVTVIVLEQRGPAPCALPPRDCTDTADRCAELAWFGPGFGYEVMPHDGEVALPDSMNYARRDLIMVVKYAAAKVTCETGGHPLGLGDMSDRDGETPGMAWSSPRHPRNTHEEGLDIDLAYYQRRPINDLVPICKHMEDGVERWHCLAPPTSLDARRSALFIGALFESPEIRIVGVDGKAAAPILGAIDRLCRAGKIEKAACARISLGYETEDTGRMWFYGHHNHMHVSYKRARTPAPTITAVPP